MWSNLKAFVAYYRAFFGEFWTQCYESWKLELRSTVGIAVIAFILTHTTDTKATGVLILTAKSAAIWLSLWVVFHLIRTPWKLSLRPAALEVDLRGKALNLSAEVLDWVYDRSQKAPKIITPVPKFGNFGDSDWVQMMEKNSLEQRAVADYERDTLGIYEFKFKRRVTSILRSLSDEGVDVRELADWHDAPVWLAPYSDHIKAVGQQLGTLADCLSV